MLIIKSKNNNEVLSTNKEYEDTEVGVFVSTVLNETKDGSLTTKKRVFIDIPDIGFVKVTDLGPIYRKLLDGYTEPLNLGEQQLNQLMPVGIRKLSFRLLESGTYETGVDNKTGKRMCFPVFDALVKEESFN